MPHLILSLNLISFIAGSAALAFILVLHKQRPGEIERLIRFVLLCLTFIVLCNGIDFYLGYFMGLNDSRIKFMTMNFLSLTILAVIALALRLAEEVTRTKLSFFVWIIYWVFSFLEYFACIGFSLFAHPDQIDPGYGYTISALYVLVWLLVVAFFILSHLRLIGKTSARQAVHVRLLVCLGLLWFIVDALSELDVFRLLFGFPRIAMSPFFLIILSSCVIVQCLRLLSVPRTVSAGNEMDSVQRGAVQPDARWDLSPREREIFDLLIMGLENADISERLFISPHTVKNHVSNIYRKSGAKNRLDLMHIPVQGEIAGR